MQLRTVVRDCLYVNWAIPREWLPDLPEGLRYEVHREDGRRLGFVSVLCFRQSGLRLAAMPFVRLSYPQLNVRFYVVDEEGVPSVLFRSLMVPRWVVPLAQATGQDWLDRARLDYPRPSRDLEAAAWVWRVAARGELEIEARTGDPACGVGPDLGPWQRTCDYFRRRDRGYVYFRRALRQIETAHGATAVWPMRTEVRDDGLLRELLRLPASEAWPAVHSAWLCPEVPLDFELAAAQPAVIPRRVPAPG